MFANGAHLAESTENSMRDETDSWKTDENADGAGLNFPACMFASAACRFHPG